MKTKTLISLIEFSLLILSSISFSFILSENFVSAQVAGPKIGTGAVRVPKPPTWTTDPVLSIPPPGRPIPIQSGELSPIPLDRVWVQQPPSTTPIGSGAPPIVEQASLGTNVATPGGGTSIVTEEGLQAVPPGTEIGGGGAGAGGGSTAGLGAQIFKGQAFGGGVPGALFSGAVWGAIVGLGAYFLAGVFGLNDKQAASVGLAAGVGTFTGTTLYFIGQNAAGGTIAYLTTPLAAAVWGVGIGVAIFLATYTKEKKEIIQFQCLPWEAPLGGDSCDLCNEDPLIPCSEYRCKSLGQACELVNKGSEEELCVWVSKGDTKSPTITPWDEALSPEGLRYVPDNTIRPPNTGVKIARLGAANGCLQAFTKLQFGVLTDEPAQCRLDYQLTDRYDEMTFLFGETNLYQREHVQQLKVPSPFADQGNESGLPEIHTDGTFTLWTRCRDANGNENVDAFAFRFCVEPGPDTTPPIIESTSIESGRPVSFNADAVPIEVYANEPAECRWSREDKAFDVMENEMSCATQTFQINSDLNYVCSGELTGIKNRENNNFYFRCKDFSNAPGGRNVMTRSFPLTLRGTEELVIESTGPIGEIEGGTSIITITLEAETSHGADEGDAVCYFSTSQDVTSFIPMFGTGGHLHNQSLDLPGGAYNYFFRCIDAGGNVAEADTSFTISVDTLAPQITRVLKDGVNLKLITDEDAKCAYSLNTCSFNFEEGLPLSYEDPTKRNVHITGWDSAATYHIKCADLQNNQPFPDSCQIIAEGAEL